MRTRSYSPDQPDWCCADCGAAFGSRAPAVATWHADTCGVCGKYKAVTEARDYGYLTPEWRKLARLRARYARDRH